MLKHKKIVTLSILTDMLLTLLPTVGFAETLVSSDAAETVIEDSTDATIPEKDGSETPVDNPDKENAEEGDTEADNQATRNKKDAEADMEPAAAAPQLLKAPIPFSKVSSQYSSVS